MAVEHVFAPKGKPLGSLPYNQPGTTVVGAEWSQFMRGEMPAVTGRNRIVDDGGHVWECELRDADTPHRNEAWRGDNAEGGVYFPGQTMGCAFGLKLDSSWPTPPSWSVLWQIHTPYDYPTRAPSYASPMTLLSADGGELRIQNNAEGGIDWRGACERGRWHYFMLEVLFGRPGWLKVWHALDTLPLTADTPVVDKSRNTSMPNHSTATGEYTKSGIYMAPSSGKTYIVRRDGYAQAASAQRARELLAAVCRPAALGTTPPPPPTSDTTLAALDREWAVFLEPRNAQNKYTQDENWRRANPGEWAKLQDYRNGGAKPSLITTTGRRMVEHVTAWRLEGGAAGPVPPPADTVDVASFGYGDAAVRQALATGKHLLFTPGVYTTTDIVVLDGITATVAAGAEVRASNKARMAFVLRGEGAKLLGPGKIGCPTAELPSGPPTSARLSTGESAAVYIDGATGFEVRGIIVERAGSAGILNYGGSDGTIAGCTVRSTLADGIHNTNGAHDVTVSGNRCEGVGDDMFAIVSYERQGVVCRDITVMDNVGVGQPWGRGVTVVGGERIQLLRNRVEDSYGAGVYVACEPAWETYGVAAVTVNGNTIVRPDRGNIHDANVLVWSARGGYTIRDVTGTDNTSDPSKPPMRATAENGGDLANINVGFA